MVTFLQNELRRKQITLSIISTLIQWKESAIAEITAETYNCVWQNRPYSNTIRSILRKKI